MSFTSDVKQEVSLKDRNDDETRAMLSGLIQMTSSLVISNRTMHLKCKTENASVSRAIYKMCKDRYGIEIQPSVKRRMNLKKNLIYVLTMEADAKKILEDLGIYSSRGLLDRPLKKIVSKDGDARAYLAGAFLAEGSVNSPNTTNYHLEIKAMNERHAALLIELLDRFHIGAKTVERRGHTIVYVKSAEKIADFLRCIGADQCLLLFEDTRISRDFASSMTRLNNVDVANDVRSMEASRKQLEDIQVLEEYDLLRNLDEKLMDVVKLRRENPEATLNELAELYRLRTGNIVSKSGLKHRFVKIHELREKAEKNDGRNVV